MSPGRLWRVFLLDFRAHLRRPLFWVLLILMAAMALLMSAGKATLSAGDSDVGGVKAFINSEFALSQTLAAMGLLFFSFFVAVASGLSVISDEEQKVGEILHATPLRVGEYIWGKAAAVLCAYLAALGLSLLLFMFCYSVLPHGSTAEYRGPFLLRAYVRPAFFLVAPFLVFLAGATFAIGERTRKAILVFALPVALLLLCIFFLWDWSPVWLPLRWNRFLMAVDPAGFRWLTETYLKVDRGVAFYNQARVVYDLPFLLSRLAFLSLGIGAVLWSHLCFARTFRGARPGAAEIALALAGREDPPARVRRRVPLELGTSRRPGLLAGAWIVARFELKGLLRQPGMYLFVPIILLQTIMQSMFAYGPFGTPLLATPGTLVVRTFGVMTTLVCFLLLFYTVESLNRDKVSGLSGISSATPLSTASLLGGKAFANSMVGVGIILANGLACLAILLIQRTVPLRLLPFLLVWGGLMVPTFLFWTTFVNAVHALTDHRYATYALGLCALLVTGLCIQRGWMTWAANWPLWGALAWSDLAPFGLDRTSLVLNRLAVLATAGFLTAFTVKVHARRERDATATLQRMGIRPLAKALWRLAPWALLPVALITTLAVRVGRGYEGAASEKQAKDYWRKNLNTYKDFPVPALQALDLDLELDPAGRGFQVKGSYRLHNHREIPLDRIPLTVPPAFEGMAWTLDGVSVQSENRAGLHILTPPGGSLAPGADLTVGFSAHGRILAGSSANGGRREYFLLAGGAVLGSGEIAPTLGFQEDVGVDKDNKTDPKEYASRWYEGVTPGLFGNDTEFTTRIRVTGPRDYTYNAVGTLAEDTVTGGRRSMLWVSDSPVTWFNVVAGRWDVRRGQGTAIFYHPGHGYNVEEMGEALDAARRFYSEWFFPYPWKDLKLSEFPALASYAQGFATNITFSEDIGFLTKSDRKANAAFLVTAHESAHQWWGNLLTPGKGPGGNVLSEGMAHFSTALLFEQVKGPQQRMTFLKGIEESYGDRRVVDSERPLVRLMGTRPGDETCTYDKGGWVFYMLHELMGRQASLEGLQDFIRQYRNQPDHPALEDFLRIMRTHAPDPAAFDAFARQWFLEVVVPRYQVTQAIRRQLPNGTWEAHFHLANEGKGTMPLAVAVARGERFLEEKDPRKPERPNPAYQEVRASLVLGPGEHRILKVLCPFQPDRIIPDPDVKVLQLKRKQAEFRF